MSLAKLVPSSCSHGTLAPYSAMEKWNEGLNMTTLSEVPDIRGISATSVPAATW